MYGNEFDSFLILLSNALETNFESICSEAACPRKSITFSSKSIEILSLNNVNHLQGNKRQFFLDCARLWLESNTVSQRKRPFNNGTLCPGIRSRTYMQEVCR